MLQDTDPVLIVRSVVACIGGRMQPCFVPSVTRDFFAISEIATLASVKPDDHSDRGSLTFIKMSKMILCSKPWVSPFLCAQNFSLSCWRTNILMREYERSRGACKEFVICHVLCTKTCTKSCTV